MPEVRNIPTDRLKWLDRESEREKLPEDYFLDPKNRRYPYRNKDGSINCYMLRSAIRLAGMHGDDGIKAKAEELWKGKNSKHKNKPKHNNKPSRK